MTRATDIPIEARAFLDALAVGESGGADDDATYSVLFGGECFFQSEHPDGQDPPIIWIGPKAAFPNPLPFGWPSVFPAWPGKWIDGVPTHAAGRYQFEPATWREQQARLGLPDFSPVSQDHAAWDLAEQVVHREMYTAEGWDLFRRLGGMTPSGSGGGSDTDLSEIAECLHSTWTSLSPDTFLDRYRAALAKLQATT